MFCLLFFYFGRAFIALPFYFHSSHYMKKKSLDMCKTLTALKQYNPNPSPTGKIGFGLFFLIDDALFAAHRFFPSCHNPSNREICSKHSPWAGAVGCSGMLPSQLSSTGIAPF